MRGLVIFDTRTGYTQAIATTIGEVLSGSLEIQVVPVRAALHAALGDFDLLVIGGPTEAHGATPALRELLGGLGEGTLDGVPAAAFDTRLHWPKLLSGSAAEEAARALEAAGCRLLLPPESFFVHDRADLADPAELGRARAWAMRLDAALPVPVG